MARDGNRVRCMGIRGGSIVIQGKSARDTSRGVWFHLPPENPQSVPRTLRRCLVVGGADEVRADTQVEAVGRLPTRDYAQAHLSRQYTIDHMQTTSGPHGVFHQFMAHQDQREPIALANADITRLCAALGGAAQPLYTAYSVEAEVTGWQNSPIPIAPEVLSPIMASAVATWTGLFGVKPVQMIEVRYWDCSGKQQRTMRPNAATRAIDTMIWSSTVGNGWGAQCIATLVFQLMYSNGRTGYFLTSQGGARLDHRGG